MVADTNGGSQRFELRLTRGPDDPPERDPAFQDELRTFSSSLRAAEIQYSQRAMTFDSSAAQGYPIAQYTIQYLGPAALTVLAAAITVWVQGRSGRKVRLKVGDIEAEARTIEEVEQLLQRALELKAKQGSSEDEA